MNAETGPDRKLYAYFDQIPVAVLVTDAEGRFEVVGTVDSLTGLDAPGSLWMTVLGDDRWSCAPREVEEPMNVVLVVDPLGGLAGRVALESADVFTSLRVELSPSGARSTGSTSAMGARSGTAEAVGSEPAPRPE